MKFDIDEFYFIFYKSVIESLLRVEKIFEPIVKEICYKAYTIFTKEPNIINISTPITVLFF